jgi:hypothetical protein
MLEELRAGALRHHRRGRIIEWPCPDGWFEPEMTDACSGFAGGLYSPPSRPLPLGSAIG